MKGHIIGRVLVIASCARQAAFSQTPVQPPRLEFEVASVRLAEAPTPQQPRTRMGGPGHKDPERVTIRRLPLLPVVNEAFDTTAFGKLRLSAPDWLDQVIVDIDAKVPPETTKEQFQVMLQNLLLDRFHLAYHSEKRQIQVYNLVIEKSGLKMKRSMNGEPAPAEQFRLDTDGFPVLPAGINQASFPANGRTSVTARGVTMASVVRSVQTALGREALVVDRTGLTGTFDYHLRYAVSFTPAAPGLEPSEPAPDILTAIREQLGLTVEKAAGQVEVVVVDHMDKTPTAN